ncbi:hypothetical protein PTTG_26887 [Puccinia triticina 1-1 BBBD Race 1]|uniref:Uncharacterized protein n=1 Tax=Puccinia triticina (isolate 1-1 / race 1 (BBBD)) TaxID=630390 RepID=A0A180GPY9_PUCT1|nr:hypothetical protein PTTG_26887 [Puccinia triticina 1-1 BBBD Race 1]
MNYVRANTGPQRLFGTREKHAGVVPERPAQRRAPPHDRSRGGRAKANGCKPIAAESAAQRRLQARLAALNGSAAPLGKPHGETPGVGIWRAVDRRKGSGHALTDRDSAAGVRFSAANKPLAPGGAAGKCQNANKATGQRYGLLWCCKPVWALAKVWPKKGQARQPNPPAWPILTPAWHTPNPRLAYRKVGRVWHKAPLGQFQARVPRTPNAVPAIKERIFPPQWLVYKLVIEKGRLPS